MTEYISEAATISEAVEVACKELGLDQDEVTIEVLEAPSSKFFGFKKTPAKVKISYKSEATTASVQDILQDLIAPLKLNYNTDFTEEDKTLKLSLKGEDLSFLADNEGEALDALQYLLSIIVNSGADDYTRVHIDVNGFRLAEQTKLEALAKKLATSVIKSGRPVTMQPMNPYERRIIHSVISEMKGVSSASIGREPRRSVVIKAAK